MQKYATRFQMVINLPRGYTILDWGQGKAGLYLAGGQGGFRNDWWGKSLLTGKMINTGTSLAASGTREELESWVAEFQK